MKKKYCVDYKIGSSYWHSEWFDTKRERDIFIEELKATYMFKTKAYIASLDKFGNVIKVKMHK